MGKQQERHAPLTQEDILKLYNDAKSNPLSREDVNTLDEVNTGGVSSSESQADAAKYQSDGNHSPDGFLKDLLKKTPEDLRIEREAQASIEKMASYVPNDYPEKVAQEVLPENDYRELKDLKRSREELLRNDPSYVDVLKRRRTLNQQALKWYEPTQNNIPRFVDDMISEMGEMLISDTAGMSEENAQKLRDIDNNIHTKSLPVLNEIKGRLEKNLSDINMKFLEFEYGEGADQTFARERALFSFAQNKLEETLESVDARINRASGWQAAMDGWDRELATAGMYGVTRDVMSVLPVLLKAEKGQQLTDGEDALYKAVAMNDNVASSDVMEQSRGYRIVDGTMKTLPFLAQMAATGGVAGGVRKGVQQTAKGMVRQGVSKGLAKGIAGTVAGASAVGVQTALMPMTYGNMVERYKGMMEVDFAEDGSVGQIYFRDDLYKKYAGGDGRKGEYEILEEADRKRLRELSNNMDAEQLASDAEAQRIMGRLGLKKVDGVMSYRDMLDRMKPASALKAIRQGAFDTANEVLTEKYAGKFMDGLANRLPFLRSVGNRFVNTKVGRIYKTVREGTSKFSEGIGLNSMPAEYMEELFVAPLASLNDGNLDEVKALGNADTHIDILGQTALMGVGFRAIGAGMTLPGRFTNKEFYRNREEIRKRLSKMRTAVDDNQLQDVINFSSAQSGFTIAEQRMQVQNLRNQGKDTEADNMEQKMFYNLAMKSFKTGTADEFMASLDDVANNTSMSDRTRANAVLAKQDVEKVKEVYDRYRTFPNVADIVQLQSNKVIGKRTLQQLEDQKTRMSDDVREDVELVTKEKGIEDVSLDNLYDREFEDAAERKRYESFLKELENRQLASLQGYDYVNLVQEEVQRTVNDSMREFNNITSPAYQAKQGRIRKLSGEVAKVLNSRGNIKIDRSVIDEAFRDVVQFKSLAKNMTSNEIQEVKESFYAQLETKRKKADDYEKEVILENTKDVPVTEEQQVPVEEPPMVEEPELAETISAGVQEINNAFVVKQDSPFDNFDEVPASTENFTEEQRRIATEKVAGIYEAMKGVNQRTPDFRDFVHHLLAYGPKEMVEENYNAYRLGWGGNGYAKTDFDKVYNEIFDPLKDITESSMHAISQLFGEPVGVSRQEARKTVERQEKEIREASKTITGFTDQNVPIRTVDGNRVVISDTKLGYNAIAYDEVIDGDGNFQRVQSREQRLNLDDNSPLDFRDLLHPDKYNPGDTMPVSVAPESMWGRIPVNLGRDDKGETITVPFSEWVATRELADPGFRDTKAFRDKVPMFVLNDKGTPMAYVHDTDWYNAYNVADPVADDTKVDLSNISVPHQELIQKGKENVSELRRRILQEGVSTLQVTSKKEGAGFVIPLDLPEITIQEANPQSIIAVQVNDRLLLGRKIPFENDKRMLVNNKDKDFREVNEKSRYRTDGHVWDVRRIGTDSKTGKETWRAFPVTRRNDGGDNGIRQDALETLRWMWAAQAKLNEKAGKTYRENVRGGAYDMDEARARTIVQEIKRITGVNLLNPSEAKDFLNTYGVPLGGPNTLQKYGETLYSKSELDFRQFTKLDYIEQNLRMVSVENGQVRDTGLDYSGYLRSILTTNYRSFNVGTEENPAYATSLQPVITFNVPDAQETPVDIVQRMRQETEPEPVMTAQNDSLEDEISEYERYLSGLGLDIDLGEDNDFMPAELVDTSNLENIFDVAPGLSILQESQITDYLFNNLLISIDAKYGTKINKRILLNELKGSYEAITGPSRAQLEAAIPNLQKLYDSNPGEQSRLATLLKKYRKAIETYDSIQENWRSMEEKALAKVERYTDIKETRDDEAREEEDMSLREKDYNKSSIEENGKDKTSYRLRRFMAGIRRYNPNGEVKKGFLGLPSYIGFNDVYNSVAQYFGTGVDIPSDLEIMLAKLKEMGESEPWVRELSDRLQKADPQIQKEFVYNYAKHALQMKFAMYSTGRNGTTFKVYDTNANEVTRLVREGWRNAFLSGKLVSRTRDTSSINTEYASKLLDIYDSWGSEKQNVEEETLRGWLSEFGIEMSDQTWKELKDGSFYYDDGFKTFSSQFYTKTGLFNLLSEYLRRIKDKKDTDFEENEKNHPFTDMQGVLNALSKVEARYTPQSMTLTFRDGGKQISGQVPTKYVTDRVNDLKRWDREQLEDFRSLSFQSGSLWVDLMLNEPKFREKFSISHNGITALKQLGKNSTGFSSVTDLNTLDHDLAKMVAFQDMQQGTVNRKYMGFGMRMAHMFLPTMSDKSQMLMLKTGVFDLMGESDTAFVRDDEGRFKPSRALEDLLVDQLVMPELTRIIKYHRDIKATDITGYDLGARMFHLVPQLNELTDDKGIRLIKYLAVGNVDVPYVMENFGDAIRSTVSDVTVKLARQKMRLWNNDSFVERDAEGYISKLNMYDKKYVENGKGNMDDRFRTGAFDFVVNNMIANANSFMVFAGDPALYSQDKLFSSLPVDNDLVGQIAELYGKKPLFTYAQDYRAFKAQVDGLLSDGNISRKLYDELMVNVRPLVHEGDAGFYEQVSKAIGTNIGKRLALLIAPGNKLAGSMKGTYLQFFAQDSIDVTENAEYLIKIFHGQEGLKKAAPILESYALARDAGDMAAMGRSRSTLMKFFPDLADYFDIESTDAQEYTTTWEHLDILENQGRITTEQLDNVKKALLEGRDLTKEELGIVMQPIKPVHTGQVMDRAQDVMRTVYIKSSSFPLLPQLTAGTALDNVREKLEQLEAKHGKPVRLSYQTANKVGSMSNAKDIFTGGLDELEDTMLELSRDNFRIQQDVPFKSDKKDIDTVAMGTQMFKLLFGDGMMDIKGFEFDGETMDGRQLYDRYSKGFQRLVDIKKNELLRELGLDEQGNSTDPKATIEKLQKMLKKEAEKRGYPIQDIKGLDLVTRQDVNGNDYYEFKVPLWLSTNSNRYESLLNSIVSNRVMVHKMPGNSFVAGSETGFARLETLDNIDRSRVIWLDGWNGKELQGAKEVDGRMQPAQVLLPSKFKDGDNQLVDLFQKKGRDYLYLQKREDGSLTLKEGMIDPELLRSFTFRTPTSSHVSGSNVEVVGILPPESGDLMVVPKNFTKQKGLDYDIDKENAYQYNHVVETDGRITKLDESHRETRLKGLLKALEDEKLMEGSPEDKLLRAMFGQEYDEAIADKLVSIQEKIKRVSDKFDEKLLENEFIDIHRAVFSNPDTEVQKKINKVLSMKFASGQADMLENLVPPSKVPFSLLSDEYQKEKMGLGAAGKLAIGVYSNYVTFHGLVQQSPVPIGMMGFEDGEFVEKDVTIGNLVSDGSLGRVMTLDGDRSVAEVFAERQNTATDNEKEQILGRVNVNSHTINVDSLLTALGFDKDSNGNSVSYTLLSQPVIKRYVEAINKGRGISSEYVPDLQETVIKNLVDELGMGMYVWDSMEGRLLDTVQFNPVDTGNELTPDRLLEGIRTGGEDSYLQLAALATFLELDQYARSLSKIQSVLNTKNLGKSMIEAYMKNKALAELADSKRFSGATSLIGSVISVEDMPTAPEGYYRIGDYWVRPDTPQGKIVVEGVYVGNNLWKNYFPHNDRYFESVVSETLSVIGTDMDNANREIEARQEIVRDIKKYIYSKRSNNIFSDPAQVERERLFMDKEGNTSLASYLNDLTSYGKKFDGYNAGVASLKGNRLLNKFSYSIGTLGEPSLIKFNNTSNDNFDEEYLYNALPELMIEDRPLPDYNGRPYSTRKLAQDLVSYAYLEGGIQEAVQFIKYVPLEYLETRLKGNVASVAEMFQSYNAERRPDTFQKLLGHVEDLENDTHRFTRQYIQHHPEKAPQYSEAMRKQYFRERDGKDSDMSTFRLEREDTPKFISYKVRTKKKTKQDKYRLFQHVGNGRYQRLAVLGTFGMSEYQYNDTGAQTLLDSRLAEAKKEPNVKAKGSRMFDPFSINDDSNLGDVMRKVSETEFDDRPNLSVAAGTLLPLLKQDTRIKVRNTGKYAGRFARSENTIYLDVGNTLKKGPSKTAMVLVHEAVHSVTSNELRKYYDPTGKALRTDVTVPQYVRDLDNVFRTFVDQVPDADITALETKLENRKNGLPAGEFTDEELDYTYGATSVFEFVTTALTSDLFAERMGKVKYQGTSKTLLQKFREAVLRILGAVSPELKEGSVAYDAIMSVLTFVENEQGGNQKMATFEGFPKKPDPSFDPDRGQQETKWDPDIFNPTGPTVDLLPDCL